MPRQRIQRLWSWLRSPRLSTARYVALVFVCTRVALLLIALAGQKAIGPEGRHHVTPRFPERAVLSALHRGDSSGFERVATSGYEASPEAGSEASPEASPAAPATKPRPEAFFPAFPLLSRWLGDLFGGEPVVAGVWLSNLAFFLALFFLHGLGRRYLDEDGARRVVLLAAVFPTSLFCSVYYSEGLYLFAVSGALYAYERDRLLFAGLCGALAALTQPTGVLLFPALAIGVLHRDRWRLGRDSARLLWLLLIPAALGVFATYLGVEKGSPWLFLTAAPGWEHANAFPLWTLFREAAQVQWDFPVRSTTQMALAFNLLVALGLCGATAYLLRRFDAALALFAGLSVLAPLATGQVTSMARFAMGIAPLFLVLGAVTARPMVERFVLYASALLLGAHALLWGTWNWAG